MILNQLNQKKNAFSFKKRFQLNFVIVVDDLFTPITIFMKLHTQNILFEMVSIDDYSEDAILSLNGSFWIIKCFLLNRL